MFIISKTVSEHTNNHISQLKKNWEDTKKTCESTNFLFLSLRNMKMLNINKEAYSSP